MKVTDLSVLLQGGYLYSY